jgi:hypothetical protein
MSQPLYFLPNLRQQQCESVAAMRAILKERGLEDVFADVPRDKIVPVETPGRGPDNKSGVILSYQRPDNQTARRMEFKESEQEWTRVDDGLYIGIDPSDPPTPDDLARRVQYSGYRVPLAGGEWLIPVIRRPDDSTLLPRDWKWDATGRDVQPIKPAYKAFWEETAEVLEWFIAEELPESATGVRALELAVRALSLNYRFGRNEQNILGVIDPDNYMTILGVTVDFPRFAQLAAAVDQKKTTLAQRTPNSGAGQEAGVQTTAPPAASC